MGATATADRNEVLRGAREARGLSIAEPARQIGVPNTRCEGLNMALALARATS
jgi:hypothetical protein